MWTKRNSISVLLSLVFLYTLLSFCFINVAMNSDDITIIFITAISHLHPFSI